MTIPLLIGKLEALKLTSSPAKTYYGAAVDDCINVVRQHQPVPVSLKDGAGAVKAVLDLSLVGPDTGFKPEDVAKACAEAWGLKYVD